MSLAKLVGQELVPELDPLMGLPPPERAALLAHAEKFPEVWVSVHHLVADLIAHYERHGGPPFDGSPSTWLRHAAAGAAILRS